MRTINLKTKKPGETVAVEVLEVSEYIASNKAEELKGIRWYNKKHKKKNTKILALPLTFDIETSHADPDGNPKARVSWMYIFQMYINGVAVTGRTWEDFRAILHHIKETLELNEERRAVIYVHNLSYEFEFVKSELPICDVFARNVRDVMSFETFGDFSGFYFRDSLALSGSSLERWSMQVPGCTIPKQSGDLDHNIKRTHMTTLTDVELSYCVGDVISLFQCINELLKIEARGISTIPMTRTGYVRRDCKRAVGFDNRKKETNKIDGKAVSDYRRWYKALQMTPEVYAMYRLAFRGGDTHAAEHAVGTRFTGVHSYDIASSYPTRLILEDFPASRPIYEANPSPSYFGWVTRKEMLYVIDVELKDVRKKDLEGLPSYISESKCAEVVNPVVFNGRIISADKFRTTITSVDLRIISQVYDFKISRIFQMVYHSKKAKLPKLLRDFVIDKYKPKTMLKDVEGKAFEYLQAKGDFNSIYGMFVQQLLNDSVEWSPECGWVEQKLEISLQNRERIAEELGDAERSKFLPYCIGVFVTAYARQDLNRALIHIGENALYWDTDCVKYLGDYGDYFEALNAERMEELKASGYEFDDYAPADIHGKRHPLGMWELEKDYTDATTFLTYGSKKYFVHNSETGKNSITVAGLNKKKACGYLEKITGGDVTLIEIGTVIPEEYSGRTFSIYDKEPFTMMVDGVEVSARSYMSIVGATYKLGEPVASLGYNIDAEEFGELINKFNTKRRR